MPPKNCSTHTPIIKQPVCGVVLALDWLGNGGRHRWVRDLMQLRADVQNANLLVGAQARLEQNHAQRQRYHLRGASLLLQWPGGAAKRSKTSTSVRSKNTLLKKNACTYRTAPLVSSSCSCKASARLASSSAAFFLRFSSSRSFSSRRCSIRSSSNYKLWS